MEVSFSADINEEDSAKRPTLPDLNNITGTFHFTGIGGIGMSALARLLLLQGKSVAGSDKAASPITEELARLGAKIFIGHTAANIAGAAGIVISTAITKDNPELQAAYHKAIPVYHRSDILASLSQNSKLIAISGTHGKTTTTGMIAQILLDNRLDPTVVIGGIFPTIGANSCLGASEYFVAEADESDKTHRNLQSFISVITNIEPDHLENYPGGFEEICDDMLSFANNSKTTVLCLDDPGCLSIATRVRNKLLTYGSTVVSPQANLTFEPHGFGLTVFNDKTKLGTLELQIPGQHNRMNALAAFAVAFELGLAFEDIAQSLAYFPGIARRFQVLGRQGNIVIIDDYAHHPTEVVATLEAACQFREQQLGSKNRGNNAKEKHRIVAVFQPHQPRRLQDFFADFCGAFTKADLVLVTDVYVARGGQIAGIDSQKLASSISHGNVHYLGGAMSKLPEKLLPYLEPGDIVLTIGAGDVTRVGTELLRLLKSSVEHGRNQ